MRSGVVFSAASASLGFGAIGVLLLRHDARAAFGLIYQIGWGLPAIVLVRGCILATAGLAWAPLVRPFGRLPFRVFGLLRWVREAINVSLPVMQFGGDLVGGRLLTFWGVAGGPAGATILVDLLTELGTQLVFTVCGLGILVSARADQRLILHVVFGLALSAFGVAGFYVAQRSRSLQWTENALIRAAQCWSFVPAGNVPRFHSSLRAIYQRPWALLASSMFHLVQWSLGVLEIWIALARMGFRPAWGECLVLESLGQAVRSAAFAIPGAIGVQEGGFLLLGAIYGVTPDAALALSLVKRIPDLVLGIPGLIAWHLIELRQLLRARVTGQRPAPTEAADS